MEYFKSKYNEYINKEFVNREGYKFKIVTYDNKRFKYGITFILTCNNSTFDDRWVKYYKTTDIKRGRIRTFYPNWYNIANNKVDILSEMDRISSTWRNMHYRTDNKKYTPKTKDILDRNYSNVTVCDEWSKLENFKNWYNEQGPYDPDLYLDKDASQYRIENKFRIYSPKTCILIPTVINSLLTIKQQRDPTLPTGIRKRNKRYVVRIGSITELGSDSKLEAFIIYKVFKELRVKLTADKYHRINKINNHAYKILSEWRAIDYNNVISDDMINDYFKSKFGSHSYNEYLKLFINGNEKYLKTLDLYRKKL